MLLSMLHDNSILSNLHIQHPGITICNNCSLRYGLFWNPHSSFYNMHFCLLMESIVLLYTRISAWCLDYEIFNTNNRWHSIDACSKDNAMKKSSTVMSEKAPITSYISYCQNATIGLPKMSLQSWLTYNWHSFSASGREYFALVLAPKGGHYIILGCLQPVVI